MFFESVIVDLDHTLYDYDLCHNTAIEGVLRNLSTTKELPMGTIRDLYDRAKKAIKLEIDGTAASHNKFLYFKKMSEFLELDALRLNKIYWKLFHREMKLREGVLDLFKFLNSRNIKIHLMTNFLAEHQYIKMKKLNILPYIETTTTSEEIGAEKPSSKIFLCCIEKIKTPRNRILLIGDDWDRDITGSIERGIFPIWLNPDAPKSVITDNYILCRNFKELLQFFCEMDSEISILESLSKYCGERYDLAQSSGGNISVKTNSGLMVIKASGYSLSDISMTRGYTIINNESLKKDLSRNQYNKLNNYNIFDGARASMETYMHSILKKYTVHIHPIQVNRLLIQKNGGSLIKRIFPESRVINYEMPGIDTCKKIMRGYKGEKLTFILNHGLIVTTDSYKELINLVELTTTSCEKIIGCDLKRYKKTNTISRTINSITGGNYITKLSEDSIIKKLFIENSSSFKAVFPDKTIFCGINFLKSEKISKALIKNYITENKDIPKIIMMGDNVYIVAESLTKCTNIESILKAHLLTIEKISNITFLSKKDEHNLNNMEAERYRKKHVYSA